MDSVRKKMKLLLIYSTSKSILNMHQDLYYFLDFLQRKAKQNETDICINSHLKEDIMHGRNNSIMVINSIVMGILKPIPQSM